MNKFRFALIIVLINAFCMVCFAQTNENSSEPSWLNNEKNALLDTYGKKIQKGRLPIDGEWTDVWNNQILVKEGKINKQYSEKHMGTNLKYEVNMTHGIKYIEPGKYESIAAGSAIKIIDRNSILITGELSDVMLIKVKLKDEEWFKKEFEYYKEKNKDRDPEPPFIVIKKVTIEPEIAVPGSPIQVQVGYKVADVTDRSDLPVKFSYSIFKSEERLLQSEVNELLAKNGQLMNRNILLNASPATGKYEF